MTVVVVQYALMQYDHTHSLPHDVYIQYMYVYYMCHLSCSLWLLLVLFFHDGFISGSTFSTPMTEPCFLYNSTDQLLDRVN